MPKRRWTFILLSFGLSIFLMSCAQTPSKADGWEYNNEDDIYVRETSYTIGDDEMTKYLEFHEGTWTASEDSEVAIIIENESIYIGFHSGYDAYPVTSYQLKGSQYSSKEDNYKPGMTSYMLSLNVPDYFAPYVDDMAMVFTLLEESTTSNDDYGFLFRAGTNGKYATYTMDRSTIEYSIISNKSSQQGTYKDKEPEETDSSIIEEVYTDGTYLVTVEGYSGPLTVETTIVDKIITDVEVIEHVETEGLADPAIEEIPNKIVDVNSTNIDIISGATITSNAIIEAVELIIEASGSGLYTDSSNRISSEKYVNNDNIYYNQQEDKITGDDGSQYIYLDQTQKWVEKDFTVDIVGFYNHLDISKVKWYVGGYDIGTAETDPNGYSENKMFKISFPIDLLSDLYNESLDGSILQPKIRAVDSNDETLIYVDSSVGITNQILNDY